MTTATIPFAGTAARPVSAAAGVPAGAFAGRGWGAYLVLAAGLAPFVLPPGPAQLALLDIANLAALAIFACVAYARRVRIALPLVVPVLVIAVGSLLATTNAVSPGAAALSLAQDAYLYGWLVALVAVMSRQGDLRAFRLAWVLVGVVVAITCIVQAQAAGAFPGQLLAAEGFRPAGTFYGANMCADYLVLCVFVALTLFGQVRRVILVPAIGLFVVGLLTTKSNGSLIALVVGLGATALLWALRDEGRRTVRLGALAFILAAGLLVGWGHAEWGIGGGGIAAMEKGSVLGRLDKSTNSRTEIWGQLGNQLGRHPLGIGPGNSVLQAVEIGHRVRPGTSFQSKEAHSDYMGYAVERGPIGLVGLLLWTVAGGLLVLGGGAGAVAGSGGRGLALLRAVLVGGLVASAVHSTVIEKLHFRHYWLFLALAIATTAGAALRPGTEETP